MIHERTAIDLSSLPRSIDKTFARTNRLRTEGTDHLLAAARAAGARRFIAQSFAGWPYKRVGGPVKTEDDPLDDSPSKPVSETLAAIMHLESAVTGAEGIEGIALRYGGFYGTGTSVTVDPPGAQVETTPEAPVPHRRRRRGISSFIQIEDPRRPPRRRWSGGTGPVQRRGRSCRRRCPSVSCPRQGG